MSTELTLCNMILRARGKAIDTWRAVYLGIIHIETQKDKEQLLKQLTSIIETLTETANSVGCIIEFED